MSETRLSSQRTNNVHVTRLPWCYWTAFYLNRGHTEQCPKPSIGPRNFQPNWYRKKKENDCRNADWPPRTQRPGGLIKRADVFAQIRKNCNLIVKIQLANVCENLLFFLRLCRMLILYWNYIMTKDINTTTVMCAWYRNKPETKQKITTTKHTTNKMTMTILHTRWLNNR